MKQILFVFLLLCVTSSFAQDKTDTAGYVRMAEKFVHYYNKGDIDGVCSLFRGLRGDCIWKDTKLPYEDYGKIVSFSFVGMYENRYGSRLAVFRVVHEKKGEKAMSFNTGIDEKFNGFSFNDMSKNIVEMLERR